MATGLATALIAGIGCAGAAADTQVAQSAPAMPNLTSPTPDTGVKPDGSDPLKVTVGKTVAVTTNQKGDVTPFNILLTAGQVSGQGSGEVKIQTGANAYQNQNVSSTSGQVQNFLGIPAPYSGTLPVTMAATVTLNGETIDPDQAYNMTGDVVINYTFTNHTGRMQTVTYKDIYGTTQSASVEVPVPFGDSFAVTFGDGWSITNSGSMSQVTSPLGLKLTDTVILFPIVEGVGGTTQTITVKARAQNASLPANTSTIVPVPLGSYFNGAALALGGVISDDVLSPLNTELQALVGNVISAGTLISGFTGGIGKFTTGYIDPLVKQIDSINLNTESLDAGLTELSTSLTDLGSLMEVNAAAQDQIAGLFTTAARIVGVNVEDLVTYLATLINDVGPAAGQAAVALQSIDTILSGIDVDDLAADSQQIAANCAAVGTTSRQYGYLNPGGLLILLEKPGAGASALQSAIRAQSSGQTKTDLQNLQQALNLQSTQTLLPALPWTLGNGPQGTEYADLLLPAACTTVSGPLGQIATFAGLWPTVAKYVPDFIDALNAVALFANSPQSKAVYNTVIKDLNTVSNLLSNPACGKNGLVNPLLAAIKQYGISGLKTHIVDVLESMFSKCGLAQVMQFFGAVDAEVGKILVAVGKAADDAKAAVPTIVGGVDKLKDITNIAGRVIDELPAIGQKVANAIDGGANELDSAGTAGLATVSNFAAQLQATIVAMNDRGTAGDGAPFGNASGPNDQTVTYAAYQVTVEEASPYTQQWTTMIILAVMFLIVAVGIGTMLYRRRHPNPRIK